MPQEGHDMFAAVIPSSLLNLTTRWLTDAGATLKLYAHNNTVTVSYDDAAFSANMQLLQAHKHYLH